MADNDAKQISLIEFVKIENLFGQFDYDIRLKESVGTDHNLLLLYGENGAGKSTILRLIYHLLSPEPYAAHRTSVAGIPFERIEIMLTSGISVTAEKKTPFDESEYVLRLRKRTEKLNIKYKWMADRTSREHPSEEYETYCRVLSDAGLAFHFLSDTRRVQGLTDDTRHRRGRRIESMSMAQRRAYERGIHDPSYVATETLVDDAIERTIEWFRQQALSGANVGYTSVNAIYAALISQIVEHGEDVDPGGSVSLDGLRQGLVSLNSRNSTFSQYGLTPALDIDKLVALLDQASPEDAPLLNTVLRPYFDGHNARLDALQAVQKVIDEFVSMLAEFFSRKAVSVDIGSKLIITTSENLRLNPEMLSSGEKQLLLLMCNAITARQDGTILIIDEPEISLNVKWQRRLIDALLTCLEGVQSQIILATHSIEILAQYRDFVAPLEDLSESNNA